MDENSARAALVTGGSTGIGRAIAAALLADGYGVTICARRPGPLKETRTELAREPGGTILAVPADVADEQQVAALMEAHLEHHGRLDVLVNCAGTIGAGTVGAGPVDGLDDVLAVNVRSVWLVCAAAVPALRRAGAEHGRALVVNVASVLGRYPSHRVAAYSASKAAVFSLSESLQRELGGEGIRVTTLAPGLVATPMSVDMGVPQDELIRPEDLAEAVRFLTRLSAHVAVPDIELRSPSARLLLP
jgi:NAD(P)-dependent dehydrogenase (short-subunit alcohol dehydrogenase family)